jgi:hypothetical protein
MELKVVARCVAAKKHGRNYGCRRNSRTENGGAPRRFRWGVCSLRGSFRRQTGQG